MKSDPFEVQRKQGRGFILMGFWLSLFLALLTGWWWLDGDRPMRGLCIGFGAVFACVALSMWLSDCFFDTGLLADARRQLSWRTVIRTLAFMLVFGSLLGIVTFLKMPIQQ
jgi:hypothetical protein